MHSFIPHTLAFLILSGNLYLSLPVLNDIQIICVLQEKELRFFLFFSPLRITHLRQNIATLEKFSDYTNKANPLISVLKIGHRSLVKAEARNVSFHVILTSTFNYRDFSSK